MINLKEIFQKELTPGMSTRVLKWRKIVYILGAIIIGSFILGGVSGTMIAFYPVVMLATPLFILSIIYLMIIGVSDKLDNTENKPFFGGNSKRTLLVSLILILLTGLVMYLNLHKYY